LLRLAVFDLRFQQLEYVHLRVLGVGRLARDLVLHLGYAPVYPHDDPSQPSQGSSASSVPANLPLVPAQLSDWVKISDKTAFEEKANIVQLNQPSETVRF
jgi:hypothetical protein